jgi:hypothetical protein
MRENEELSRMGGRSLLVAAFTDTAAATWFNVVPLRTFPLKPWTIPEGSPKPRLGAVHGGGFADTCLRAMELITNLNRCHHFQGFIYQHARFTSDKKGIEILVRPRKSSAAIWKRSRICKASEHFSRMTFK